MRHIQTYHLFESTSRNMTLIVGLPGSGKSELTKRLNPQGTQVEFDDPDPFEWDSDSTADKPYAQIEDALEQGESLIINSGDFIMPHGKELLDTFKEMGERHGYTIRTIYFENDPEQCLKNQSERGYRSFTKEEMLQASKTYHIPPGAEIVPVYRRD